VVENRPNRSVTDSLFYVGRYFAAVAPAGSTNSAGRYSPGCVRAGRVLLTGPLISFPTEFALDRMYVGASLSRGRFMWLRLSFSDSSAPPLRCGRAQDVGFHQQAPEQAQPPCIKSSFQAAASFASRADLSRRGRWRRVEERQGVASQQTRFLLALDKRIQTQ
jgi:hypothetical protein